MKILKLLSKILPLVFWLLLLFGFDSPWIAFLTALSAAIHEIGHLMFTSFKSTPQLYAHPSGFRIKENTVSSYKREILLISGGPVFNILASSIAFCIANICKSEYMLDFAVINLLTAASNLLPISGYDGYRIIECVIFGFSVEPDRLHRSLEIVSALLSSALLFLALYFMLKIGEGYWIFAILFISMLIKIKKHVANTNLRE